VDFSRDPETQITKAAHQPPISRLSAAYPHLVFNLAAPANPPQYTAHCTNYSSPACGVFLSPVETETGFSCHKPNFHFLYAFYMSNHYAAIFALHVPLQKSLSLP
jgi:hypothetical protein